jgi:hypothetical protein
MEPARQEYAPREEERCRDPVLTVYGETVRNDLLAQQALGAGKNLPGPM